MRQLIGVVTVLMVALFTHVAEGVAVINTGKGMMYKLGVTQDVWLEREYYNYNNYNYLIVSRLPQFPNKRSLVQFENLPSRCPYSKILSAKMYLYYVYAHKASWHSIYQTPFIPRHLQVHLVKKSWNEAQATTRKRDNSHWWTTKWLGLDNNDAEAEAQPQTVTMFPYRQAGFVEFDITNAIRRWSSGVPNYGLVIRATNELEAGRSVRFASNRWKDKKQHAYVMVLCSY